MIPPSSRPIPRFVADAPQEGIPEGDFAEKLAAEFAVACALLEAEAGQPLDTDSLRWFPSRRWGGRIYVPVNARGLVEEVAAGGDEDADEAEVPTPVEYFGHVSYVHKSDGEDSHFQAKTDFTDITVEDNPEWDIDFNDDVIGQWHGDAADGHGGDITLVWGMPLLPGGSIVTAELGGEIMDQTPLSDGRFTLVSVDALRGFAEPAYLEVIVWDGSQRRAVARESLYDVDE